MTSNNNRWDNFTRQEKMEISFALYRLHITDGCLSDLNTMRTLREELNGIVIQEAQA